MAVTTDRWFLCGCSRKAKSFPTSPELDPLRAEALQLVRVDRDAQAGLGRDRQEPLVIETEGFGGKLIDVGAGGQVFDVGGDWDRGGELEIRREADGGVPAMGDHLDVVVVRQP